MRLNKYIARAGIASRRKADELTKNGEVKVNGLTVREPGYDVRDEDAVEVSGRLVGRADKPVYIMLNKPAGCVTTAKDDRKRPTVMDFTADIEERIFPVGRLDYATSGLLIMTNDGELAHALTHPKHEIYKTYIAKVSGVISDEKLAKLRRGVDIGGFVTSPAKVAVIGQAGRVAEVEIQILEGRNRQVRKMFAAVGGSVVGLKRVAVGDIRLGRLKEGQYRKLRREEVDCLIAPPSNNSNEI
ncbi:MAG: rRNA pseudouridine synthase [Clostridiales Family XIII bacterium]|nr:rRNA pseudouridine synthase [Clostridiales Family XIII bacterium]